MVLLDYKDSNYQTIHPYNGSVRNNYIPNQLSVIMKIQSLSVQVYKQDRTHTDMGNFIIPHVDHISVVDNHIICKMINIVYVSKRLY